VQYYCVALPEQQLMDLRLSGMDTKPWHKSDLRKMTGEEKERGAFFDMKELQEFWRTWIKICFLTLI
jgi:hypothetical protein